MATKNTKKSGKISRKNNKKTNKQPFEFGKFMTALIVGFFLINFEAIVVTSFVLMFTFGDLTPLSEMIIGTFSVITIVVSATVGFYQWKTKTLNLIKLKKFLGLPVTNQDLNEKNPENYEDFSDEDNSVG